MTRFFIERNIKRTYNPARPAGAEAILTRTGAAQSKQLSWSRCSCKRLAARGNEPPPGMSQGRRSRERMRLLESDRSIRQAGRTSWTSRNMLDMAVNRPSGSIPSLLWPFGIIYRTRKLNILVNDFLLHAWQTPSSQPGKFLRVQALSRALCQADRDERASLRLRHLLAVSLHPAPRDVQRGGRRHGAPHLLLFRMIENLKESFSLFTLTIFSFSFFQTPMQKNTHTYLYMHTRLLTAKVSDQYTCTPLSHEST